MRMWVVLSNVEFSSYQGLKLTINEPSRLIQDKSYIVVEVFKYMSIKYMSKYFDLN